MLALCLATALALGDARAELRAQLAALVSKDAAMEDALAQVRRGPPVAGDPRSDAAAGEKLARFGSTVVGYLFRHEDATYRYAVDFPPGFETGKRVPLLLDPGHGTGAQKDDAGKAEFLPFFRNSANTAGLRDWLIVRSEIVEEIGADGKRGALPEDQVAAVFGSLRRALLTRFPVDPERIYVSGLSQTGFWAWYLGRERAFELAGIAPMSAVAWQVQPELSNLASLPVFVLHGSEDPTCDVQQARTAVAGLQRLGAGVRYLEVAGAGHDVKVWSRLPEALKWLAEQPRERFPRRQSRTLTTLSNPWCSWLCVEKLERPGEGKASTRPVAGIDAEIAGQTIRLFSQGVERVRLALAPQMLDLEHEIVVEWNGKQVFKGKPECKLETALDLAAERCDWTALFPSVLALAAP
jgi:acetyl esterase/lipase